MMARNLEGQLVYTKTGTFWHIFTPKMAEVMAIKEAVSWSKTGGEVEMESVCLGIIQAISCSVHTVLPTRLVIEKVESFSEG